MSTPSDSPGLQQIALKYLKEQAGSVTLEELLQEISSFMNAFSSMNAPKLGLIKVQVTPSSVAPTIPTGDTAAIVLLVTKMMERFDNFEHRNKQGSRQGNYQQGDNVQGFIPS